MTTRHSQSTSIYNDESVLSSTYEPDQLHGHDEFLQRYKQSIGRVLQNETPKNIFIHGDPGVGKSAVTREVTNQLQEAGEFIKPNIHKVSYRLNNNPASWNIAKQLVNEIRDLRQIEDQYYAVRHSFSNVMDALFEEFRNLGGIILLVLEEIKVPDNYIDFLDELTLRSRSLQPNTKIIVISISDNPDAFSHISSAVSSRLTEEVIHFPGYNQPQLELILQYCAESAFKEEVLQPDALSTCAELTAQAGGSARRGRWLLYVASEEALKDNSEQITVEHIRTAEASIRSHR